MIRRALLLSVSLGLAGCGGPPTLPALSPAPVAACLTLVVQDTPLPNVSDRDVQKAVRASFEEAMVGAGFNVLADQALPHDLVARLEVTPGSRIESGTRVRAILTLERGGKVIDRIESSLAQATAGYQTTLADALVDGIFRSGELAVFTRALRSPRSGDHLAASALRVALTPPACAPAQPATVVEPPPPAPVALPASPSRLVAGPAQPSAFALIVGVDAYKNAPAVPAARADAERFAELCRRTLGVPEGHIKIILGDKADKLAFDLTAEWLKLNVPRGGRIYFFFSGRGALRRQTVVEYLLPHDGDPRALDKTSVSLPGYLQLLAESRAKEIIAVVDAGFSGVGGRSVPSGENPRPPGNISDPEIPPRVALLSAVSSADVAGDEAGGTGGLFTRYVTEGVGTARADIDGDGRISLQEILAWASPRVTRQAKRDKRVQTPNLLLGVGVGNATQIALAAGLPVQ